MNCPHCDSKTIAKKGKTSLGYQSYKCSSCERKFNERTGTEFNFLEYPTDVVLLAVRWYLMYKLSLRDICEMFLERGFEFSHETVRNWVDRFSPLISMQLRKKRRGKSGESWYLDETYVKVKGKWCYLYRAIDRNGNLIDSMLSKTRDLKAAKRFLKRAKLFAGNTPDRITTDNHESYKRAIKEEISENTTHRTNRYLNNLVEQDHRFVKQRYYVTKGFGSFAFAKNFFSACEEVRQFFKKRKRGEKITLAKSRNLHQEKIEEFNSINFG